MVHLVTVRQKLLAFVALVTVAFGAGFGLGAAVDPVLDEPAEAEHAPDAEDHP